MLSDGRSKMVVIQAARDRSALKYFPKDYHRRCSLKLNPNGCPVVNWKPIELEIGLLAFLSE